MNYSIRRLRPGDAADIARAANHEETAVNLRRALPYPYLFSDAAQFIAQTEEEESRIFARAVCVDDVLIGLIILRRGEDTQGGSAEIGYFLHPSWRGHGIMASAVRDVTAEALKDATLFRIYAVPYADDHAARRVLEKAGFAQEACQHHGALREGQPADTCVYAITRD